MLGEKRGFRLLVMFRFATLWLLANAAMAQGVPGSRYAISEEHVVKELGGYGVAVDMSQIHIPSHMSAAIASPKLEIVTVEPLGDKHLRIELRCATVAECLPFFATVDAEDADLVSAKIRSKPGSGSAANQQMVGPLGGGSVIRPLLKVGARAMLEIRDRHIDIHLPVLAIDTGTIGQRVRVSTLDRKKVFHGTVTGEGIVMGEME